MTTDKQPFYPQNRDEQGYYECNKLVFENNFQNLQVFFQSFF